MSEHRTYYSIDALFEREKYSKGTNFYEQRTSGEASSHLACQ